MQKTTSDLIVNYESKHRSQPKFFLLVDMRLKTSDEGGGSPNMAGVPRDTSVTTKRTGAAKKIREDFVRLGVQVRPIFEKAVGFDLFLSGEVIEGAVPLDAIRHGGYQFVNLWHMHNPSEIPVMMDKLADPPDKSATYGQLDDLVAQEDQDAMRRFPAGGKPPQVGRGNKLYYILLTVFPESSDLAAFAADFDLSTDPTVASKVSVKLLVSLYSMTGLLNRIVQFWSLEVKESTTDAQAIKLAKKETAKLKDWYKTQYRSQRPVILRPTAWDVTVKP